MERLLDFSFEWVLPGHGAWHHAASAGSRRRLNSTHHVSPLPLPVLGQRACRNGREPLRLRDAELPRRSDRQRGAPPFDGGDGVTELTARSNAEVAAALSTDGGYTELAELDAQHPVIDWRATVTACGVRCSA